MRLLASRRKIAKLSKRAEEVSLPKSPAIVRRNLHQLIVRETQEAQTPSQESVELVGRTPNDRASVETTETRAPRREM